MYTRTLASTLAAGAFLLAAGALAAEQTWRVQEGTVSVSLYRQLISGSGLEISNLRQTATPLATLEEAVGFAIAPTSDLEFSVLTGLYKGWTSGAVRAQGGFDLRGKGGTISAQNFSIAHRANGTNDSLYLVTNSGPADFELAHTKVIFERPDRNIVFGFADLIISREGARRLGRPDLAGQIIGMVTVDGKAAFVGGDPKDPDLEVPEADGGSGNGDVMLWTLGSCSSFGRVGTYPNGTSGLGMSTTSCNVTTVNERVNWFRQMDERHPVIAQNMYRKRTMPDGSTRLEQIGIGWVKHGFTSTNSPGCGTCQSSPSQYLGIRCTDTYGASLNASRSWLGPRNEVNPFTGRWTCLGSYFANYQNDCVERFNTTGLSPIDHRLQVRDQDLLVTNSQFYYEGYYVSENDFDRYNNAAWRPCNVTWTGSSWTFSPTANQTQGVLVDSYGDIQPAPRAQPDDEGDVLVAVEVTDIGGGQWHYEYVVYNHTSNREMRSFFVPLPNGATVSNIGFHDTGFDAANDWTGQVVNGGIQWSTDTYIVNDEANSLKWGEAYNFRFDANVAPTDGPVGTGLYKPGTLQSLAATSRVPTSGQHAPTTMSVSPGNVLLGAVQDIMFGDDYHLQLRAGIVLSPSQPTIRLNVESVSPSENPSSMTFRFEGHATSTGLGRTIEAFNFSTGQWVVVQNTTQSTATDTVTNVTIPTPAQFVQDGSRLVRVRVSFRPTQPILQFPYTAKIDQATWIIN